MKVIIRDHERGILHEDGRPIEWLEPGRHRRYGWFRTLHVQRLDLNEGYVAYTPELADLIPEGASQTLDVPGQHVAILEIDELPTVRLEPGKYLLWRLRHEVTAVLYDLRPLVVEVDRKHVALLPNTTERQVRVAPWMEVLVYVDGQLATTLKEGLHVLGAADQKLTTEVVDMRVQERQIVGQEVMTKDKVTLRLNVVAQYQITDAVKQATAVLNLADAVYTEVQLAARQMVSSMTVDELLAGRSTARTRMKDDVQTRVDAWGIKIRTVDLKDIILPGDMKALLNRVIEAEKEAAAQVILRREETAATRSMANTAKMLEQNPMLLRLKELDTMKDLAGRIDQLTVVTGLPEWMPRTMGGGPTPKS